MFEFSTASISRISVQQVQRERSARPAATLLQDFSDDEKELLLKTFSNPFANVQAVYEFTHPVATDLNPLYKLASDLQKNADFTATSNAIAAHLLSVSKHPNIKDGELFIAYFDTICYRNQDYPALGVYKVENKEPFLETIADESGNMVLQLRRGISGRKMDKACLVVFTEDDWHVFVPDNNQQDAEYWKRDFVNVKLKNDTLNNTSQFLSLTKTFLTERLPAEQELSKSEVADLLNRSVSYFREHDHFNINQFQELVLQDQDLIQSFQQFGSRYSAEQNISIAGDFPISGEAVKKQSRIFKSVLKLDKNFHVYIHGDTQLIEKGFDASRGKNFYKIYFDVEQ